MTAKTNKEITDVVKEANYDDSCAGIVAWCHTFSPSKMWINGLAALQKPYCHLATQYNREIPNEEIDMDFMNLNQAAHGDREHGFIAARLRMPRKVIAGHWQDETVRERLGRWMRAAVGVAVSKNMKVMRFGDNMREVAVTEGDKVEVQTKLGWQVNTWAVGDLVKEMNAVTDAEIDLLMGQYQASYDIATDNIGAIRYQAREEIAIVRPHVLHLMRGQVFEIGGLTWFTMGGAASHDIEDGILDPATPDFERRYWMLRRMNARFRVLGRSWWPEEMPSEAEYAEAVANLERAGWCVDCILTHCAPTSIAQRMNRHYQPDRLTDFLETVRQRCRFSQWFCGHCHINQVIDERFVIQWEQISRIEADSI